MNTTTQAGQAVSDAPRRKRRAVTPAQLEVREAKRVERLRKSFERVTVKAKSDILKAIKKGKPSYDIESRVPEREACFGQLRTRLVSLREDERAARVLMPMWENFVDWAATEQLAIQLQPRGIGHATGSRWYVCIKAEPLRKPAQQRPIRPARPFGRLQ